MILARACCLTVIMLALGSGAFATPVPPETERLIRAASPAQLDIVAAISARASFDVNMNPNPRLAPKAPTPLPASRSFTLLVPE